MSLPKIGHMNVPNIGSLAGEAEERDAIHMAVAPLIAACTLIPGQPIGLTPEGTAAAIDPFLGVVDPFLRFPVLAGQRFWCLIEPNTITTLRHAWTHPAFTTESLPAPRTNSEAWLREFAADVGVQYSQMMEAAAGELRHAGDYPIVLSYGTPNRVYDDKAEFWKHFRNVVPNAPVPEGFDNTFITCSC